MKRVFILFTIASLLSCELKAQEKKDSVSAATASVTDSTALISIQDLAPVYTELKKLPYDQAKPFVEYLEKLVAIRIQLYNQKPASKPAKKSK